MATSTPSADNLRHPILGALYHPPGGIISYDAVNWGYAKGAAAQGVHIHQDTEVTGIDVAEGRIRGVRTTKGDIATRVVLNATAVEDPERRRWWVRWP